MFGQFKVVLTRVLLLLSLSSPDVVAQFSLEISSPGVAVLYPGPEPVARLLLAPLRLAGAVGHEGVRLISDPLRLGSRRVSAEERELVTKGRICSLFANGQESGHFVITPTHCMTNGPLGIYYPFTSFAKGSFSEFDEGGLASFLVCKNKQKPFSENGFCWPW